MVPIRAAGALGLLFGALTSIAPAAPGAGKPLPPDRQSQIESAVTRRQQATKSLAAAFEQSLSLAGTDRPVTSTGRIFFASPDRLKIDYSRPAGEFLLVADNAVWVKKQDRRVVKRALTEAGASSLPLLRFLGQPAADWRRDHHVAVFEEDAAFRVELIPKNPGERQPGRILCRLDKQTLDPMSIDVLMPGNNRLAFRFSDWKRNAPLPSGIFDPPTAEPQPRPDIFPRRAP